MDIDARFAWLLDAAKARVDHTTARSHELLGDISRWRTSDPVKTSLVLKPAPQSGWYLEVESADPPRLAAWSLQIAEVAHHLRSILNTTLTRIVKQDGGVPSPALQYPIALTPRSWKHQRNRIRELPERVQRAIYASQPFLWARDTGKLAANHVLAVLAWVDNEDKHRLELEGHLAPAWVEVASRIVTSDGVSRRVEPRLTYDWSLSPGSRMVDADTSPYVIQHMDRVTLDLQIEVLFPDELGTTTIVPKLLDEMWSAFRDAMFAMSAAWADPASDSSHLAGATDFLPGAAFGKSAVDGLAGAGVWDKDYSHRRATTPPFTWSDPTQLRLPEKAEPTQAEKQRAAFVDWQSISGLYGRRQS